MDELDFFEKEDLKEVARKTLIDIKYLKKFKDKDFENISKTKGLGFLKIIEREYRVDLSYERDNFLNYIKTVKKSDKEEYFIAPPPKNSNRFAKFLAISILIMIALGVSYLIYINTNIFKTDNNPYKTNQIVSEAKKIAKIKIDVNDSNISEENITMKNLKNDNNSSNIENVNMIVTEQNQSQETIYESNNPKKESNLTATKENTSKSSETEQNPTDNFKSIIKTKSTNKSIHLTIAPKKRIWVGVIDLSNYKKKSYLRDTNITIDTQKGILLTTGHGLFKLVYKNKTYNFSGRNPKRFYIKDDNITQISKKEFVKMNRGKYW